MLRANGPAIRILIDDRWNSHERLGRWPACQMGLIDLARRFALGQALRTNRPLARNRNLHFATPNRGMSGLKVEVGRFGWIEMKNVASFSNLPDRKFLDSLCAAYPLIVGQRH